MIFVISLARGAIKTTKHDTFVFDVGFQRNSFMLVHLLNPGRKMLKRNTKKCWISTKKVLIYARTFAKSWAEKVEKEYQNVLGFNQKGTNLCSYIC